MKNLIFIILSVVLSTMSIPVLAHTTSTSYLTINMDQKNISGIWQLSLKDIDLQLDLDSNRDSKLIWSEIISQEKNILLEMKRSIVLSSNSNSCSIEKITLMLDRRVTEVYLYIPFKTNCSITNNFNLQYNFLFNQDSFHKAILNITQANNNITTILSDSSREYHYDQKPVNLIKHLLTFITQGIWHVLIGLDHVLFVLCLLLSATIYTHRHCSSNNTLSSSDSDNKLKPLVSNVVKLVTTFTIAHSITLILASTKILVIPPTIIEPVIALSVIVLALLNLSTRNNYKHWPLVFAFGLIHGFGFAFVLEELPVQSSNIFSSLFGFNLGVELGQLIIVCSVLPFLYLLNSKNFYHRIIIPVTSTLIAFIGLFWLIDRSNILNII